MKTLVKCHNDVNKINFSKFSVKELDLFFAICFKIKELGVQEIKISFNDIKHLIKEIENPKRVKLYIDSLNKKLALLNYQIESSHNVFERIVLFTNFISNYNDNTLTIKVNDRFSYLFNNLIGNFNKFDLVEFIELKSVYSKNIFRVLKQWESLKIKEFKIEEFKEILSVPDSYTTSKFNEKVLKPIMEELPQYFPNLKLEKIKTGKKVTSLKFTWSGKVEKIEPKKIDDVIDIIEISEELNKTIEKAKKNRFIEKLLTIDNIEILTQMFQENDLVKGLLWAYKEVRQDVSTLNYLVKTIKTGAEKKEKKIVVKTSEEKQPNLFEKTFEEIPFNFEEEPKEKEVQKISKEEYEKLYKKYLKENKIAHNKVTRLSFDNSIGFKYAVIETESQEKIYLLDELPQEKLLSKSGKLLVGGALIARLEKLAKEMQISISYKDKIISYKI